MELIILENLFGSNNNKYRNFKLVRKDYNKLDKNFLKKFNLIVDLANVSNDPSSELDPKFTITNNYINKKKKNFIKNYQIFKKNMFMPQLAQFMEKIFI